MIGYFDWKECLPSLCELFAIHNNAKNVFVYRYFVGCSCANVRSMSLADRAVRQQVSCPIYCLSITPVCPSWETLASLCRCLSAASKNRKSHLKVTRTSLFCSPFPSFFCHLGKTLIRHSQKSGKIKTRPSHTIHDTVRSAHLILILPAL